MAPHIRALARGESSPKYRIVPTAIWYMFHQNIDKFLVRILLRDRLIGFRILCYVLYFLIPHSCESMLGDWRSSNVSADGPRTPFLGGNWLFCPKSRAAGDPG